MVCGTAGALCPTVPLQFRRQETSNANVTPCHDADFEQRCPVARGTLRCHLSAAEHCRGTGRREGAPVSKFKTGARSESIGRGLRLFGIRKPLSPWAEFQRLTFELTGAPRQGGLARLAKMYRVPPTGPS